VPDSKLVTRSLMTLSIESPGVDCDDGEVYDVGPAAGNETRNSAPGSQLRARPAPRL
jgi:hypothetical protein